MPFDAASIAFFYVKYESPTIVCFDRKEYVINYSLERIQHLLSELQFFRLNRQYLANFIAVKEVEHYFARKLLVKLVVPVTEKLLVSKEKSDKLFTVAGKQIKSAKIITGPLGSPVIYPLPSTKCKIVDFHLGI